MFDAAWHREYALLELAEGIARSEYRSARGKRKEAALEKLRIAGAARFDFEMAKTKIVDVATLTTDKWIKAMLPRRA